MVRGIERKAIAIVCQVAAQQRTQQHFSFLIQIDKAIQSLNSNDFPEITDATIGYPDSRISMNLTQLDILSSCNKSNP